MLDLQAFGPPALRAGAELTQPKRLGLLLFLVLARPRGLQRRDTLLALLWPDLDRVRGRRALSQALFYLRQTLPEGILITRGAEEVGVDPHRIRCDVIDFERALEEERWEEALTLYRGELLSGFHVSNAPGFEDWLAAERERLRELAARAAWSEASKRLELEEPANAERFAERAVLLAPADEGPVRKFIRALANAGDRVAALRLFERHRRTLANDLEVEPGPDTMALARALRTGPDISPRPPEVEGEGDEAMTEGESESPSQAGSTETLQAHALFRKGMGAFDSGLPEDYARALSHFEAALRLDPNRAGPHAGLALLLAAYPTLSYRTPPEYGDRLRRAAHRALELDSASGHAWIARGYYLWTRERDWLEAEKAVERAMELDPDDPHVLLLAADYHRMLGRLAEATRSLDRLARLGPSPPYAQVLRAGVELTLAEHGEMDLAVPLRRLEAVLRREPSYGLAHLWRAIALYHTDRRARILASVETSLRINPEIPLAHGYRGAVLARWGRKDEAMEEEAWFRREEERSPVDRFCWGILRLALGDLEGGFGLMVEGVDRHPSFLLPGFRLMLAYRRLWDDFRFREVMDALWPGRHREVVGPYGWQWDGTSGGPGTPG
jgi:DNA-binding SARP family transcriptional activator